MTRIRPFFLATLLAPLSIACGGGDDGGDGSNDAMAASSPGIEAGVEESKRVDTLSAEEREAICIANIKYEQETIPHEKRCLVGAGTLTLFVLEGDEDPVTFCHDTADLCESGSEIDTSAQDCATPPELAGCTATVAELEACYAALIDASAAALNGFTPPTCAEAASGELDIFAFAGAVVLTEDVDECSVLEAACIPEDNFDE